MNLDLSPWLQALPGIQDFGGSILIIVCRLKHYEAKLLWLDIPGAAWNKWLYLLSNAFDSRLE